MAELEDIGLQPVIVPVLPIFTLSIVLKPFNFKANGEASMAVYQSGNPALKPDAFTGFDKAAMQGGAMTVQGTVNKVALMLLTVVASGAFVWQRYAESLEFSSIAPLFFVGMFGGFCVSLAIVFRQQLAPRLALVYAVLEGLVLGGFSAFMEQRYPGLVSQALMLTFATFVALLALYKARIVRGTEKLRGMVFAATAGIACYYLLSLVLSFIGIDLGLINDSGIFGIMFSLFVVGVAAMNLVVDFAVIEEGAMAGAPRYMEWYGAFGLIVTLVWLYIEMLRLLGKLRRR